MLRNQCLKEIAPDATTLFFGVSDLDNGYAHVAGDIDVGNNNLTDIAFVYDEYWGAADTTAIAMADVALHEAGHTYGLFHVRSKRHPETMGLRYSTSQSFWAQDTSYMDKTFRLREFTGTQNSYQVMNNTFVTNGATSPPTSGPVANTNYLSEELLYNQHRHAEHANLVDHDHDRCFSFFDVDGLDRPDDADIFGSQVQRVDDVFASQGVAASEPTPVGPWTGRLDLSSASLSLFSHDYDEDRDEVSLWEMARQWNPHSLVDLTLASHSS